MPNAAGNPLSTGGLAVAFSVQPGSAGTVIIGSVVDGGAGTYTAQVTGVLVGTVTLTATINAVAVASTASVTVQPGQPSAARSTLSVASSVVSGSSVVATVQAKDAPGNLLTAGGAAVVFSTQAGTGTALAGGTSGRPRSPVPSTTTTAPTRDSSPACSRARSRSRRCSTASRSPRRRPSRSSPVRRPTLPPPPACPPPPSRRARPWW